MFKLEIVVNGEMELGINPVFTFSTHENLYIFANTCFENGYAVIINKTE